MDRRGRIVEGKLAAVGAALGAVAAIVLLYRLTYAADFLAPIIILVLPSLVCALGARTVWPPLVANAAFVATVLLLAVAKKQRWSSDDLGFTLTASALTLGAGFLIGALNRAIRS